MPEPADGLSDRIAGTSAGLLPLVRDAQATWRARAVKTQVETGTAGEGATDDRAAVTIVATPGWRSFEDAFPTFYQFTNRPR